MATVTIRNLPDDVRDKLRVQAAKRGHSMEAEARAILAAAVQDPRAEPTTPSPAILQDWVAANRRPGDVDGSATETFMASRRRNAILETIADGLDPVTAFGKNLDRILKEAGWTKGDLRKAIAAKK